MCLDKDMLFRRFRKIGRAVEHVQRMRIIVGVFLKYGYEPLARRLPLPSPWHLPFKSQRQIQEHIALLTPPERLRAALEELGPTFVKLGQLLSTRTHLLPRAYTLELANLHDQVPPFPFDQVKAILRAEFKRPLEDIFMTIEESPIGSASIAQVHRAILITGQNCVVKVQRPGIEKTVRVDLELMAYLATLLENHVDGWRVHQPSAVVAEFARSMEQELDFGAEAGHIERFANQFKNEPTIYVPAVVPGLVTKRVLTMEYIEAVKASNFDALGLAGLDRRQIATNITDLVMKQIFVHGFFHADPHPGNLLVMSKGRLGILDGGMVGRIDDELRERIIEVLLAAADRDAPRLAEVIAVTCKAPANLDRSGLSYDLMEVFGQYGTQSIGEFDVSGALTSVTRLIHEYNLVMPSRLSMLIKCLIVLEGTGRALSPKFSLAGLLEPYRTQFVLHQFSPQVLLKKAKKLHRELDVLMEAVPRGLNNLLEQLQAGKFAVRLMDPPLESAVNRLVYGVYISVLLLSSSLLWSHQVPPTIRGTSVIGCVGFIAAIVLGAKMMWSIRRLNTSKRNKEE